MFNVSHEFTDSVSAAPSSHSMWPPFLFLPETPLISFLSCFQRGRPSYVVVVLQECSSGLLKFFKDFFKHWLLFSPTLILDHFHQNDF